MMIFLAVFFKVSLIAAGRNRAGITDFDHADIIILISRILHGNSPRTAVRLCTNGTNIAAQRKPCGFHTLFL